MPDMTYATNHFLYDDAAKDAYQTLRTHVFSQTQEILSKNKSRPITLMKHDKNDMFGCICGVMVPGWLHITLLWVEPAYRGHGVGSDLLAAIEAEARRLGVKHAYVWTQDFEAPDFYRKHGYLEFIQMHEFGPTQRLYGLKKDLD